ncbi:MAG TPA: NIPSNAP family protein, partial [Parafilimonas sp.]
THRNTLWKEFENDEEWKKVNTASDANGKIVKSMESVFLDPEEFTPEIKESIKNPERVFQLRIYTCLPNKLGDLERRMRDYTLKLFESHGMTNIAYWKTHEKDSTVTPKLIYILANASEAAFEKSWDEFRQDPKWIALRDSSEKNGKIVDNIKPIFLKPLEFSKYK